MKTLSTSLVVLLLSLSAAQANEFQFACTDSSTAPKISFAGTSVEHFGNKYQVSAITQINGGSNLTMSDPSKEEATSYLGHLDDSNGAQISIYLGASMQQGTMSLNKVFGFGQLDTLPKDGTFTAVATVTQLNDEPGSSELANIQLNCLGVVKGGGSVSFWSNLTSAVVNTLTKIAFPQDGDNN